MGRKGNQQKNGLDQRSQSHKKGVSDRGPSPSTAEGGGNLNDEMDHIQEGKNGKKKNRKSQKKESKAMDETIKSHAVPCTDNAELDTSNITTADASNMGDGINSAHIPNLDSTNSSDDISSNGRNSEEGLEFPETVVFKFIRTAAMSVARSSAERVERHKPTFVNLKSNTLKARDHVRTKIQKAQPIIFKWIMHIGNIMLLLFMVWLECTLRGIDSFLRMGTTSFFSIIWCSVLSVIAMVGISKFMIAAVIAAAVGLFLGFTLAVLLTGIIGTIFLWFYGSFWTTGLIIFLGGLAFLTSHDRIALFITSAYSVYCAWNYVGWFGLLVGLNLSFISSDALLFFLRNMINEQRPPNGSQDQAAGQTSFPPNEGSPIDGDPLADRGPGVPSTSGSDSETTSEDEVVRLLNSTDHYAALGLARFENIDVSVIKKEYRKKAMLVHPDKNMGNEKAAEAFKKLQNAYEVLLDSFKRKEYDDELRREELLNYFRKFQNASLESRGHGLFRSGFAHSEADGDESLLAESRRIACRKCGFFHLWAYTKKSKSKARWCQECKDFHPAKDGDGWVEQSSRPFFFGLLQQVEAPSAYVCADGKVYDVSEWYICQGMRCPVNTHKPSFHVNTSVVSKNGPTKGTSPGQRVPTPNMEETMTEEEFYEWLQNAVQSGVFENFPGTSSENPKGSGNNNGSSSSSAGSKRRKKGKKQW